MDVGINIHGADIFIHPHMLRVASEERKKYKFLQQLSTPL